MMFLEWVKEILFPRKCVLCQTILPREQTDLCGDCRSGGSEWFNSGRKLPHFQGIAAVWFYEDQVRDSLRRFKFSGKRSYAGAYGRLLAMQVLRELPKVDLITWVPVSGKRKWTRGYDQSELLAKALSGELGIPAMPTLRKIRDNPAQSGISDPIRRLANVRDIYRLKPDCDLSGRKILLVDDILTTGATACSCAKILESGGCDALYLAVVATGRRKRHRKNDSAPV
jgi:ComF family protein